MRCTYNHGELGRIWKKEVKVYLKAEIGWKNPHPLHKKNTLASEEKFNEILWADKYINSLILISDTYNQNLKTDQNATRLIMISLDSGMCYSFIDVITKTRLLKITLTNNGKK
jgi:hypothetical protein